MPGPVALPLGVVLNQSAPGEAPGGEFAGSEIYQQNVFTVPVAVPACQLFWLLYDLPSLGPEGGRYYAFGEAEGTFGIKVYGPHGEPWGGTFGGNGQLLHEVPTLGLSPGDQITVVSQTGEHFVLPPAVPPPRPPLALLLFAFSMTIGGGAALLLRAHDYPSGTATGYSPGWTPIFKGEALPGYSSEGALVVQWREATPTFGLPVWEPEIPFEPTPAGVGITTARDEGLSNSYHATANEAESHYTITPGDFTLGEGPLKHGGWRLDFYASGTGAGDAGHLLSECLGGGETYGYPPWGFHPPKANHVLTPVLYLPIASGPSVGTILKEKIITTSPELYDLHVGYQQTGITDPHSFLCGGAPTSTAHAVSYWIGLVEGFEAEEAGEVEALRGLEGPDTGDLYVGGVLVGKGVPLAFSEADAIAGVEVEWLGGTLPPLLVEEEGGEEIYGEPPSIHFPDRMVLPLVGGEFNTLDFNWTVHIVLYFPPDIKKEEEEKRQKEIEEAIKKEEEEAAKEKEKEEEEAAKEKEKAEEEGGGPGEEKPPGEETLAEEEEKRELLGEGKVTPGPSGGGVVPFDDG